MCIVFYIFSYFLFFMCNCYTISALNGELNIQHIKLCDPVFTCMWQINKPEISD